MNSNNESFRVIICNGFLAQDVLRKVYFKKNKTTKITESYESKFNDIYESKFNTFEKDEKNNTIEMTEEECKFNRMDDELIAETKKYMYLHNKPFNASFRVIELEPEYLNDYSITENAIGYENIVYYVGNRKYISHDKIKNNDILEQNLVQFLDEEGVVETYNYTNNQQKKNRKKHLKKKRNNKVIYYSETECNEVEHNEVEHNEIESNEIEYDEIFGVPSTPSPIVSPLNSPKMSIPYNIISYIK